MTQRRPMGSLEREVLERLWTHSEGVTPAKVKEELAGALAYTTVMTILGRLWKKGLVERERHGRAYAYRAIVSEEDLAARRMREAFDVASDRPAVLARFVDSLSDSDAEALRRIIDAGTA